MDTIQCPACGAINPIQAAACQECNEDLNTVRSVIDTANRHYNEALALAQGGRLDEAAGQVEAAIAMASHNLNYHLLLGTIYAQKEEWEEAIRAWERCLAISPETEKAFHNIEKAHQIQEEMERERREKPFFLTSIAAVAVTVFLFITTGFYAYQSYVKNGQISQLIEAVNAKTGESNSWEQKYNALNSNFPKEGLQGLIEQVSQWKTLADQRAVTIEQLEKRYKDTVDQRNKDIQQNQETMKGLQDQILNLKQTITQINPLRQSYTMKTKEAESLQQKITELNTTLEANKKTIGELTQQLSKSQSSLTSNKTGTQSAIQQARAEYDRKIEELRVQVQQLLDQVAQKDREIADIQYADSLSIEAIQLIEKSKFSDASSRIQKALERRKDHTVALSIQQKLDGILKSPVERELQIQINTKQEELRSQVRSQLAVDNIARAKGLLEKGQYGQSIELAKQTVAFLPANSSEVQQCRQLIDQAEEEEATITRQLSEVRGYIEKQDTRKAKALLKEILRKAPSLDEAIALQKKLEL